MKQVEITTRVKDSLENIDKILKNKNFEIIRKSQIEDVYLSNFKNNLTDNNINDILSKSVLVRYLDENGNIYKKITYKDKRYVNNVLQYEEKINISIDNTQNAIKLFKKIGFEKLVTVKYDCIVYSNKKLELAFQNVENLGLLLEYENKNDFNNATLEVINNEKLNMLQEIKNLGINVSDETDIRKAYELLKWRPWE
mgnify:FL=1